MIMLSLPSCMVVIMCAHISFGKQYPCLFYKFFINLLS